MPQHPFRKVGDAYYDLRPLYAWLKPLPKYLSQEGKEKGPKPMPDWVVVGPLHRVISVSEKGLVLQSQVWNGYYHALQDTEPIFLANYPFAGEVVDSQRISFIAKRAGTIQYETAGGAIKTVKAFDYGLPHARTNGTASKSQ
jgi:hypothetical protein